MKALLILVTMLAACAAFAAEPAPVTAEWEWPTHTCDGGTISAAEIDQAELYIDDEPIAAAWEATGDPCNDPTDVPPDLAQVQSITSTEPSVTVNLPRGATYYFRIRVQVNGEWSNLSAQAEREVGFSKPRIPIIVRIG